MRRGEGTFLLGLLTVGATLYLLSQPRCGAGCKTVLQHMLTCELRAFSRRLANGEELQYWPGPTVPG
jgi:hypothetical protein